MKRIIDLTDKELVELITRSVQKMIDPVGERLSELEKAFALQAPSFDIEHAAMYCGNKSRSFVENARRSHNLPTIKAGGQSTRILKTDLDHYLVGGAFTEEGAQIPLPANRQLKLTCPRRHPALDPGSPDSRITNNESQKTQKTRAELKKSGS